MPPPNDTERLHTELLALDRRLLLLHAYIVGEIGEPGKSGTVHRLIGELTADLARVDGLLRGAGTDAGMLTRIDRLERDGERQRWFSRVLGAAAIVGVAEAVWRVVRGP